MTRLLDNLTGCLKSRVIFNGIIRTFTNGVLPTVTSEQSPCSLARLRKRFFSNTAGYTSLLLYDGLSAQELPLMTRKLCGNGILQLCCKADRHKGICMKGCDDRASQSSGNSCKNIETVLCSLTKIQCSNEIFSMMEKLPSDFLCPLLALQILKQIVEIDNKPSPIDRGREFSVAQFKSVRNTCMNQLVDVILTSDSSSILYEAFITLRKDVLSGSNAEFKKKLCEEIICKLCEGCYNVTDMCKIVELSSSILSPTVIEKSWLGFIARERHITSSNDVIAVCQILPYLHHSRNIILSMLERSCLKIWWAFKGPDIVQIIFILNKHRIYSQNLFAISVQWMLEHVLSFTEDEFLQIINCFLDSDYFNNKLEKIFVKFLNSKKLQTDGLCLVCIIQYCVKYRIKSGPILDIAADAIINNGTFMSPYILKTVFQPFGYFHYSPKSSGKFWIVFEQVVRNKFSFFQPVDILEIIVGCLYLEKQPINFVKRIFNPHFLSRVMNGKDEYIKELSRQRLKTIDSAMTIECAQYHGPLLPKERAGKLWQDTRLRRIVNNIKPVLISIVGDPDRIAYSVVPPQLHAVDLYVIDILIHPSKLEKLFISLNGENKLYMAVLILLPEHFCVDQTSISGPQHMRQRHLQKLGFQVVTLNYRKLSELRMEPAKLKYYMENILKFSERN